MLPSRWSCTRTACSTGRCAARCALRGPAAAHSSVQQVSGNCLLLCAMLLIGTSLNGLLPAAYAVSQNDTPHNLSMRYYELHCRCCTRSIVYTSPTQFDFFCHKKCHHDNCHSSCVMPSKALTSSGEYSLFLLALYQSRMRPTNGEISAAPASAQAAACTHLLHLSRVQISKIAFKSIAICTAASQPCFMADKNGELQPHRHHTTRTLAVTHSKTRQDTDKEVYQTQL